MYFRSAQSSLDTKYIHRKLGPRVLSLPKAFRVLICMLWRPQNGSFLRAEKGPHSQMLSMCETHIQKSPIALFCGLTSAARSKGWRGKGKAQHKRKKGEI